MAIQMHIQHNRLSRDETGAVAIEYALIVVLIVLVLISAHQAIGSAVVGFFMTAADGL